MVSAYRSYLRARNPHQRRDDVLAYGLLALLLLSFTFVLAAFAWGAVATHGVSALAWVLPLEVGGVVGCWWWVS